MFKMMELSKPLQEDIKKNQLNLKVAIKNHQALVLKLRGSYDDPNEIKQQLTDIQKHIISLGEAQKVLVARVKKEIAAKSWNNNNNSIEEESHLSSERHIPSLLTPSTTTAKLKSYTKPLGPSESEQKGKRKSDELDFEDEEDNDDEDEDEDIPSLLPAKRHKPMLSVRRPSTPASAHDFHQNDALGSSSDDSQESAAFHESPPASEVNKEQFMSLLNLITKDTLTQLQSKHGERRRRRLAGHHSLYTSHWDLTVQRRSRTRLDRDTERQQDVEREESPIGSPPIVEIKKRNDSSSDSTSQSPPPLNKSSHDDSTYRNICVICRKQGILSICDSCSATYHWSCLDKIKNCPQCQVGQIGPDSQNNSRSGSPNPGDDALSKVLGDTSKPPTLVSSKEVIERYNRNVRSADESNFAERLKVKKKLEARKAALKMDLTTLEEKAAKLSESIVNQNANMKELSAGEEKIRERIKKVVDFISSMKRAESVPS